jgi:geranylgeranyl reductase family protein
LEIHSMNVSEPEPYDVLVVGTGPAGNPASITCSRAGLKVLQIEREFLPRRKTCGGGLSYKALQALPIAIDPVIERSIEAVWVCSGPNRAVLKKLTKPGAMVCREKFDHFMAEAAQAAGSHLLTGCSFLGFEREPDGLIRVATSQGQVRTRVLVGADGVHSQVRKCLYPKQTVQTVPAIEALMTPSPEVLKAFESRAVIDFNAIEGGYGWAFPKADHLNVGVYRLYKTKNNTDLRQALNRFIDSHPLLRGGTVGNFRGFEIPIRAVSSQLVQDQVLLTGDAAGLGEAFYGEGIAFAIQSGCQAGKFIVAHLMHGEPLERYSEWARGLRLDLLGSRLTANLFYRMPGLGFDWMVRNPIVSDLFAGVVSGEVSPWQCLGRTVLGSPSWLLKKRHPLTRLAPVIE